MGRLRSRPHEQAQEPDVAFHDAFRTSEDDAWWLDPDPTREEIEDEDRFRLRHREAFRRAADYVATVLVDKPDEKAVLGQRLGTPSDTMGVRFEETAEMDLSELDLP